MDRNASSGGQKQKDISKVTKIATAVAVAAALVFPGAAALADISRPAVKANLSKEQLSVKKAEVKAKTEELKACREANRAAQGQFRKANLAAEAARRLAVSQMNNAHREAMKAAKGDSQALQTLLASRKAAIQKLQERFRATKKTAEAKLQASAKRCIEG